VYSWGYQTLAAGIAVAVLLAARRTAVVRPGFILFSLGVFVLACGTQLLSLPNSTLNQIGPGAARFLRAVNVAYASGVVDHHALSIDPPQTIRGLAFLLVGAAWAATCASCARHTPGFARDLSRNLVVLGVGIGTIGLAQKATFNGKLLWFWEPMFYATNGFGPFVNRNHFAGWMLLALALGVGHLCGRFTRDAAATELTWRERVLWIGSPAGTWAILTGMAVFVMACSLVWTMSRSGIAGAGVAVGILIAAAARKARRQALRPALGACVLFGAIAVIAWRGTDTLVDWYANTQTLEWRFVLWNDTLPALKDFWITGSGFNTYGTLMLAYPRTHVWVYPLEAHNDYLQLAVEGGLLLCVPAVLLIGAVARAIVRRLTQPQDEMTWWIRMGATAGICGIAVQESTEFSLQIPGVALLFATCIALAVHEPSPVRSHRVRRTHTAPREVFTTELWSGEPQPAARG
jgi:O-antigen ligase